MHVHTRTEPEEGKIDPQQRGCPSAAGFFQLKHLILSAVIYGNWLLTWGFFCSSGDPLAGESRAAVRAGEEREEGGWGLEESQGGVGGEKCERGTWILQ